MPIRLHRESNPSTPPIAFDETGAALAHELCQPLTALTLYLQSVRRANQGQREGARLPPRASAMLDKALQEAERAGLIIQRMRHRGSIGQGPSRLSDLNALLDEAVDLTMLGRRPNARIARLFSLSLPLVMIDPVQIQQLVVNLVRNALEAVRGASRPEVGICTALAGSEVLFTVQDNGPGISARALPNLFKPFVSSKARGLGLGLVISRAIARRHGGDLTVEPGGHGKGAAFTLHLPVPALPSDAAFSTRGTER